MQVSCVRPQGYTVRRLRERGLDAAADQYERLVGVAVPNLARLLIRARQNRQTIVHTRVASIPGRQAGGQVRVGRWVPPGSEEAQIIEELQPEPGELVLSKACSGVFVGTNLDFLLRRLGITSLLVGGVVTNGCVEQAITHGHDLGYACVLASDGSAALTDEIHQNALERLEHRRAHVLSTHTLLSMTHVEGT